MLVSNRISQESWYYMISNVIGSCMVLFDVVAEFSFSQLVVQTGWLVVSAVALGLAIKARFAKEEDDCRAANDMVIPDSDAIVSINHRRT
ncbi:MAG: hypothetical protein CMF48_01165 [Legionellales bacterium]|nr:hypothetical protein [Legionellales bacterium]